MPPVRWLVDTRGPREPEPPVLDPSARQRLAHWKRAAERELRQLDKALERIGCSTRLQRAPSRGAINVDRTATALRSEITAVDEQLAAS